MGLEQARELAERHAGHSLAQATVETEDLGVVTVVDFRESTSTGCEVRYTVDTTHGQFKGWRQDADGAPPEAPAKLADAELLQIAKETAATHMGVAADDMEWKIVTDADNVVQFSALGPLAGDPPRVGLTPACGVEVSRRNGVVLALSIDMPWTTEPLPIKVTEQQAIEIALRQPQCGGTPEPPKLSQRGDRATWTVVFPMGGTRQRICRVDAVTGEARVTSTAGLPPGLSADAVSAAGSANQDRTEPSTASVVPAPAEGPEIASEPIPPTVSRWGTAVAIAGGGALCAGAGILLLRRRR
jgi:hypothetical protein